MIRWGRFALLIVLAIFLTACGMNVKTGSSQGGKITKLVVGTDAAYAPMEYMNDKGEIVGIDIEVVKAIGKEMGVDVEFKNLGWDPLFPAVENDEIDLAVSSITITDDRKKTYDFSEPYFVANQLILVPENSDVKEFKDLKDKKVSVQINTTGHIVVKDLLGKTSSKILAAESTPLAITEMVNGNADATVGDNAVIKDYVKNNPKTKMKIIEDSSFEKEYYGLMVKKGNKDVLELLNKGLQKLKENGKLKEITGMEVK